MEVIIIFFWLFFSFLVGMASSGKQGGFWAYFFLSFFLTPIIAFIIALLMPKKEPQKVKIIGESMADEINKLSELKEKGIISEKEFLKQKEKLLK